MSKTEDPAVETDGPAPGPDAQTAPRADERTASDRLSTAPKDDREDTAPAPASFGIVGWARWFWRQLTSMRVALILLFMLSIASIPGSLVPQRSVDQTKVDDFFKAHETLAPLYDKVQLFDVYSSVWFSAIYILLFISLIGCIVPRTWQFVGQLRSRPPGAPGRLTRMPAYTTWRTDSSPEEVRTLALAMLKKKRFRAHVDSTAVTAEKGYLREAGNLIFHIALIVLLLAFATGQLFKSEGGKLITEGSGFSNTLTQYDDFKSGSLFDKDNDLEPFSFHLDNFVGTYERTGPQRGTPRIYEAHITYSEGADGKPKKGVIEVNTPLTVGGSKVHLIGHGYSPTLTIRDGRGKVVFQGPAPLLPTDSNVTSTGAIKVMDGYRDKDGKRTQLGFTAVFVPTFGGAGKGSMFSKYPGLDYPALALTGYHGSLGVDAGLPQNVYQLDTRKMTQFKKPDGSPFAKMLLPGETMTLPDGAGSVTFEKDIKEWATFQVSQQPGNMWALAGAIAAILGLAASLFIQRRRIWVRAVRSDDGTTLVEMAGLGRSESNRLPEELAALAETLHTQAPTTATPPPAEESPVEGARA
ncbi:cytochrome c biosynthesis protein [Streptomyces spiroverticillatus]|uniref:Cytochrome c biosynthesis protein n=1 Tax=Streptomyces finlayi TaxID=67296 RepID=A0A919C871_9ACTN|nr:cytochrome c biogenesis protein ResB [Streptomyces finlayi]GGZ90096.1 cytochrome c biosynthesis protein [Streptomyces spiroverticillatus]GHC80911.1 cytochrome c biosynthesis protein [Streptomyces finlayi]